MSKKLNKDNKILNLFKKKNKKHKAQPRKINRFYEFEKICKMSQEDLKDYLYGVLKKKYETVIVNDGEDGYLFAKGTVPVMLLAHMDTVHPELPWFFKYTENDNVISSPQGIGGDDRCGVYMILEIIKELDCSVLFLENEEMGCKGAKTFSDDYKKGFIHNLDINYMIEFDRRGSRDAVYYDLDNLDFEDFITDASGGHFETNFGSCSDISYVAPAVGVAAVNLSCGYYKEHTTEHTVNRKEMETNIEKAKMIIETEVEKPFEYKEIVYNWKKDWGSTSKYGKYFYDDAWDDYDWYHYTGYNKVKDSNKGFEEGKIKDEGYEYEIYFVDEDGTEAVDYFYGHNNYEALGKFMEAHVFVSYMSVYTVIKTDGIDYSTADRYYYEGAEQKYDDWADEKAGG